MKICVDATPLLLRSAGVKNYLYYWIEALQQQAGSNSVSAFPFLGELRPLTHEASLWSPMETYPRLAALFAARFGGAVILDPMIGDAKIFHTSNQVRAVSRRAKTTGTIHDLTCWSMPELHTAANVRADAEFADRVWRRAAALICVSENTRQDAIQYLKIAPEKLHTIHSGVPDRFFVTKTPARPLGLPKPYVLCLGTVEPRKNIDRLLDAWQALPKYLHQEFDLVVAGPEGWQVDQTMARLRSGKYSIKYIGYIPESALVALTAAATAFVYPSLYEGFGFPVAQAMAAGVAVVTSNNSCLPEIAGPGALLVDPNSQAEISRAMQRLLEDATLRHSLAAAGREHAEHYRWSVCAQKSWNLFESLA
jgi:glycosyltransferase involved in cell wall biosynthesis